MDAVGMRLGRELCPASCRATCREINAVQASIRECISRIVYAGVRILARMAQSDLLEAAHAVLSHMIGNNC